MIAAGSIDRPARVRAMRDAAAWGFTVGSALFRHAFGARPLAAQIDAILGIEGVTA
ncbi:hypothetical protein B7760_04093 [Burkholderia glumae]|uniref:hypothetical protein n=1 Tax=Burkholderia glumae TaxID=337 RepID=UPI00192A5209|nr:hypothetical protein [Burkholderia glumae]MCR1767412.1 hypothetical protein [Burkholderia glumae]QKM50033.1 hypothetical protein B7760_04093 [Burkholderia glumae]